MLTLEKFSLGIGDRFAQQAKAQLAAFQLAADKGVDLVPVWNKSNREHVTVGSEPLTVREAADAAVLALQWRKPYYVDADHIRLETVNRFLDCSDFFTIDVADSIGKKPESIDLENFVSNRQELIGKISIKGMADGVEISRDYLRAVASKYLRAIKDAGAIYRHIRNVKGDHFIPEISMDETESPQTPQELLIILAALAEEGIALQTIAPKFTGRFNKGVDYVGDLEQFEREFNDDIAVIRYAVEHFALPKNLKLSVHSGSDKFSIYPVIRRALKNTGAGVHIKTAGTTWLEEVIGLAEAGGEGLDLAKEIYSDALEHIDELCAPYASVIDIRRGNLPSSEKVRSWDSNQFVGALRHEQKNPAFNPDVRQLLHVGYKIAAKKGEKYLGLLRENEPVVARNVTTNLFERHIKPLFLN